MSNHAQPERRLVAGLGLILAAGTIACYWPARHFDFVSCDDPLYASENPMVRGGLSWPGFFWAFRSVQGGNWNPLVWLSHMLDCQLFGLNAGGHHLTNLLLHTANVLLLFLTAVYMTGATWRGAFAAALFAWDPLRVESVAWISERKDVLSTLFWLATILAYAAFTRAQGRRRPVFYGLALLLFVFGLMSKPMLVTLPVVLLLLDFWPLRRAEPPRRLLAEKVPFLALSALASLVAFWAQKGAGAVGTQPLEMRLENTAVSYVIYLAKFFWPSRLAFFYPYPQSIPDWQALGAVVALAVISLAVIGARRDRPYLGVGWLWFLVTLAPVIGLIPIGMQAWADRYSYVPQMGLALMVSWSLGDIVKAWPRLRLPVAGAAALALGCCVVATSSQLDTWQDNTHLYEHALRVTSGNYIASENLGIVMGIEGNLDEAIRLLEQAIHFNPQLPSPYYNLIKALILRHDFERALSVGEQGLRVAPDNPKLLNNLAWIYATNPKPALRDGPKALAMALHACELTRRQDAAILDTLAAAYAETGRFPEAIQTAEEMRALALADHDTNTAQMAAQRLELYKADKPYHDEE